MTVPVLAIIPARFGSTRFPGKPLVDIAGVPMIVRVARQVERAHSVDQVIVATDDERIATVVNDAGLDCEMTSRRHSSGTDRVAEVAARFEPSKLVVNIQGDEPLIDPRDIDILVDETRAAGTDLGTLATPISAGELEDENVVKVVRAQSGEALYFSRAAIPHKGGASHSLRHIGVYAYRPTALERLSELAPTPLENVERLEQLRALEHGMSIFVALARSPLTSASVDVPADVDRVVALLNQSKEQSHGTP